MPEMNGRDLVNNILSFSPPIKTLFMSGYTADILSKDRTIDSDVNFIQKPFSRNELANKVRQALES
ncbi:MAG: two-component system cell cycle sensor histidine kinase/response regulator CckA [Desulforhopalus sp.]|jgi:two-component system cell cycle sensor histidine kinase/response regulator CckA